MIKRLTPSCIKIGNEYGLAWGSGCEPISTVKVLGKKDNGIFANLVPIPHSFFLASFSEYSILDSYKEVRIANLYFSHDYMRVTLQETPTPQPNDFFWLYESYLELVTVGRQAL